MSEPLRSAGAKDTEPTAADRRAAERHQADLQLMYQPGSGRLDLFWWLGRLRDVSASGFSVMTQQPLNPGTILTLEVKDLDECDALPPEARVVHATPLPNGRWLVGCQFPYSLNEEELRRLTGQEAST